MSYNKPYSRVFCIRALCSRVLFENNFGLYFIMLKSLLLAIILSVYTSMSIASSPPMRENIPWEEAVEIIKTGQATLVRQSSNLDVTIILKTAALISTRQPQLNDVLEVIKQCGDACKDIKIVSDS